MQLNEQLVSGVTGDEVVSQYKIEIGELYNETVILKAQITKQQALIRKVFNKNPKAFPEEFRIEEVKNDAKNK